MGRGPLAGPVVTACVCIPKTGWCRAWTIPRSSRISAAKALYPLLLQAADYARTAFVPPEVIDEVNILNATKTAMEECAAGFDGLFLVDAVDGAAFARGSPFHRARDALSYMIGAASIVAKVERDRYMVELDAQYPQYGFARNKGYGTAEHIAALKAYGPCPAHRRTFIGKILGGGV